MGRPVLATLVLLACLAGCAKGPPPRAWAASVCHALGPWRTEINALTTTAQEQTPQSTTPEQAKENLVRMLGGARDATEKARSEVEAAGVPEVKDGKTIAAKMTESLTKVRDAYGTARDTIDALSTADPASFYTGVQTAMNRLQQDYAASALDTTNLRSTELQTAFAEAPECH